LKDILEVKRASREEVSDLILNVRMALRILWISLPSIIKQLHSNKY
jgi:hypothetical protein